MKKQMKERCKAIQKRKTKMEKLREKGITLIALVVTIIILLILAGVTLSLSLSQNGLFSRAQNAADRYKKAQSDEEGLVADLEKETENYVGGNTPTVNPTPSGKPTIKVEGSQVTLTEENVKNYLGKKVTNYKTDTNGIDTVNGYKVSKEYRLYYVDFKNKYGDGEGTIYLKADNTTDEYELQLDDSSAEDENIKIKQLNPELYAEGKEPPSSDLIPMKGVTWLLNASKWDTLRNGVNSEVVKSIKYIVGAPSLEMMIDSYNTKYADVLTGIDGPDKVEKLEEGERRKLFYRFREGYYGYEIGPYGGLSWGPSSIDGAIGSDDSINSVYYPENGSYWIASPSADSQYMVVICESSYSRLAFSSCDALGCGSDFNSFCPVVALEADAILELES